MEPLQPRLDHHAALWSAVAAKVPEHTVVTEVDAGLDPTYTPVSIVTEPVVRTATEYTRGVFTATFSVLTYAGTEAEARRVHNDVADAVLALGDMEYGGVVARASKVVCTVEPSALPSSAAPEWPGVVSSYTTYIRTWR
jgi:hypothetical protein